MSKFLDDMENLARASEEDMEGLAQRPPITGPLSPDTLTSAPKRAAALGALEEGETLLRRFLEQFENRVHRFEADVSTLDFSPDETSAFLSECKRQVESMTEPLRLMLSWVDETQSLLAFMEQRQGRAFVRDGTLYFASAEDTARYNAAIERLKYLRRKVRESLDRMPQREAEAEAQARAALAELDAYLGRPDDPQRAPASVPSP